MTTPETTANSSLHSREHANIPPERRDHRGTTVSTAGSRVDTHEIVLIHGVIRREIGQLPRLFRAAANDPARSKIIGGHAGNVGLPATTTPARRRCSFPCSASACARPGADGPNGCPHAQVNDAVVAINAELPTWTTSVDAAAGERMAACIDTTMPTLIGHLDEEEQKLLPVVSVTLTQSEWDVLGKHGISVIPVTRRLLTLGYITEETDDAERQKFMQVVPAPVRLAYKLIGHRQFTRETTAIRADPSRDPTPQPEPSLGLCVDPFNAAGASAAPATVHPSSTCQPTRNSDDIVASGGSPPTSPSPQSTGPPGADSPSTPPAKRTSPCSCSR